MLQVSLKLLRCKVNVSVLRNIIRIVIDALKVAFLIQETGLSNFDEWLPVFDSKEKVFQSDFIISENSRVSHSVFLNQRISFDARNQHIDDLLPGEFQIIDESWIELLLEIGKRVVHNHYNFFGLGKESIRLFFNDI